MQTRGILPKLRVLCSPGCAMDFITSFGSTFFPAGRVHSTSESPAFFARRIHQHKYEPIEGFTQKYKCHRLVYYESHQDVQVAIAREKQIKRWSREKNIALIERVNPRWEDLAENWGHGMRFQGQSLVETP